MFKSFSYLLLLVTIDIYEINGSDQDLCNICEPGKSSEHIFCMFPNPGPSNKANCKDVDISITDEKFRKKVLDWHNNFRNQMAGNTWKGQVGKGFPKAANMRLLYYDYQLEKLARRHIQNCYRDHEGCPKVVRFKYGQNLGWSAEQAKSRLPKDSEGSWENWAEEIKDFDLLDIDDFGKGDQKRVVTHFTSLSWGETRVLGCAQAYITDETSDIPYKLEVTCNYGPGGNILGVPMYLRGEPGSKCHPSTSADPNSTYPNLCQGIHPSDVPYLDEKELLPSRGNIDVALGVLTISVIWITLVKKFL